MDECRTCPGCRITKTAVEFHRNRGRRDGLSFYCRACASLKMAARWIGDRDKYRAMSHRSYQRNRDRAVAKARQYREENREAVRAASRACKRRKYEQDPTRFLLANAARYALLKRGVQVFEITPDRLRARLEYWGWKCWMCGGAYEALDHVKPLIKGGPHMLANIRPSCTSCNSRKQGHWPLPPIAKEV